MACELSLAERGALALDAAAAALDTAGDAGAFLHALKRNHRLWLAVSRVAARQNWPLPDRRQSSFALAATARGGANDDVVQALLHLNRQVSRALAGGDLGHIRDRATSLWESLGRPNGGDFPRWLEIQIEDLVPLTTAVPH